MGLHEAITTEKCRKSDESWSYMGVWGLGLAGEVEESLWSVDEWSSYGILKSRGEDNCIRVRTMASLSSTPHPWPWQCQ